MVNKREKKISKFQFLSSSPQGIEEVCYLSNFDSMENMRYY